MDAFERCLARLRVSENLIRARGDALSRFYALILYSRRININLSRQGIFRLHQLVILHPDECRVDVVFFQFFLVASADSR